MNEPRGMPLEQRAPASATRGPRQAHLEGFDLHANVWVAANDRAGVERLSCYVLRPPFAQERLRLRSDGRIALASQTTITEPPSTWQEALVPMIHRAVGQAVRLQRQARGEKPGMGCAS